LKVWFCHKKQKLIKAGGATEVQQSNKDKVLKNIETKGKKIIKLIFMFLHPLHFL